MSYKAKALNYKIPLFFVIVNLLILIYFTQITLADSLGNTIEASIEKSIIDEEITFLIDGYSIKEKYDLNLNSVKELEIQIHHPLKIEQILIQSNCDEFNLLSSEILSINNINKKEFDQKLFENSEIVSLGKFELPKFSRSQEKYTFVIEIKYVIKGKIEIQKIIQELNFISNLEIKNLDPSTETDDMIAELLKKQAESELTKQTENINVVNNNDSNNITHNNSNDSYSDNKLLTTESTTTPYFNYALVKDALDKEKLRILETKELAKLSLTDIGIENINEEYENVGIKLLRSKKQRENSISIDSINTIAKEMNSPALDNAIKNLNNNSIEKEIEKEILLFKVKNIELDKEMYFSKVILSFEIEEIGENFTIIEIIPKDIAISTEELAFNIDPEIIEEDPIVKWNFDSIPKNTQISLSYTVQKNIEKVSTKTITAMNMIPQEINDKENNIYNNPLIIYIILGIIMGVLFIYGSHLKNTKKNSK